MKVMTVGEVIKRELELRGMSQLAAAATMGISEQYLSDIIAGRRNISPQVALKLERVFGTSALQWMVMDVERRLEKARNGLV